jgi:ABC-2 type transport system permease protein
MRMILGLDTPDQGTALVGGSFVAGRVVLPGHGFTAAIGIVLGLLFVLPVIGNLMNDPHWQEWVLKLAPMTAGLAVQATKRLDTLPIAPWSGLGLLAAYAATAIAAGTVLFLLRDA